MKQCRNDIVALVSLVFLVVLFFARLFYPQPNLIITPDFGRSDAWHFSFATKVSLSRALQNGTLPLWEPLLGGGFPLFAEGQVGALFLPNLILFRLLPVTYAYNSALALAFLTLSIGTYLYTRAHGRSATASLFAAAVFTFSALPVLQLPHITLLQGITIMPLILWAMRRGRMILAAILLSQQIFAGFPQAVLLTLLMIIGQSVYYSWNKKSWIPVVHALGTTLLGIGLGAVQLFPSYEFLTQIGEPNGFDYHTASYFSFPPVHFKTFLFPFALGNPKWGTYPPFYAFDGSIFWENTAYMGVVPLLLAFLIFRKKWLDPWKTFWLITLGTSVLLSLGKYAPTYIVYTLWPFTLFRVPSRFLWISSLSLSVISAYGLDSLRIGKWLRIVLLMVALSQLFLTWRGYHLLASDASSLTKATKLAPLFDGNTRLVFTPDVGVRYSREFGNGWANRTAYEALRDIPMPDSNIILKIPSYQVYAGRYVRRTALSESLVLSNIEVGEHEATISALGQKLLSLYGVTDIIMTGPLTHSGFRKKGSVMLTPDLSATVYENPDAVSRFRLVRQATAGWTVKDASRIISDPAFSPDSSAIVASFDVSSNNALSEITKQTRPVGRLAPQGTIAVIQDTPTRTTLAVHANPALSLLIATDTYYPGWQAVVDGKPAKIYAANISQRAVLIPSGDHIVDMIYRPWSFRVGAAVSLTALLIIAGLTGYPHLALRARTGKTVRLLFPNRPGNHARQMTHTEESVRRQ